jgi:hypothetical protein
MNSTLFYNEFSIPLANYTSHNNPPTPGQKDAGAEEVKNEEWMEADKSL